MRRAALAAVLGALAVVGAHGPAAADDSAIAIAGTDGPLEGVYERGVVEVEPSVSAIRTVHIENHLGDVRIEGHDSDRVVIHAFKRAPDDATLERLKVILVPDPNGVVRIGSRIATGAEMKRLSAGAVRIDLVVHAPRSAAVVGAVWNGALSVSGMDNGAELSANEGDIVVESSSGRIVTSSALGAQKLREIVGEVDARGMYGELDLEIVRGRRLAATMHEGRVVARRIKSRSVTVQVTRGDIVLHGEPQLGGSWSIITYRGNIEIAVARRAAMQIRARARRGTVKLPSAVQPARADSSGWIAGNHGAARNPAQIELAAHLGNIRVDW